MTIRTFYRPEETMLEMLAVYGLNIKSINGHHCVISVVDNALTQEFLRNNPDGCEVIKMEVEPFPAYNVINVGVSLSQFTIDDFKKLNGSKLSSAFQFTNLNVRPWNGAKTLREVLKPTQVPDLYIAPSETAYMWHDGSPKEEYTVLETKFVELLNGFDFYYDYSDDLSVYRRWNNKWEEIQKQGSELGLSNTRMNEIYRQLSGR